MCGRFARRSTQEVLADWFGVEMEGMPFFTANVGDVVYAPQGRWHRASWAGTGMSTRIAINPRPYGMHNFDPESGAKQ